MENILISIIIPIYNSEKFIDRCIKSVINQSYKNIEVIIVNDGSEDRSKYISESYAKADSRIKVYSKVNGGPSSSRNYGLSKVNGQFITFVDADDHIDNLMIEKMVSKISQYNNTVIFCGNYEIYKEKTEERILYLDNKEELNKEVVMREIAIGRAGLICCKLFSFNIIKDFNIKFDENIQMCEDQIFFLQVCQHATEFENIYEALYFYDRTNESSITIKYQPEAYKNQLYIQNQIEKIFYKNNLNTRENNKIIKMRLRQGIWYCINNEFSKSNLISTRNKIKNVGEIIKNTKIEDIAYEDNLELSKIDMIIRFGIRNNKPMLVSIILFSIVNIILPIKMNLRK